MKTYEILFKSMLGQSQIGGSDMSPHLPALFLLVKEALQDGDVVELGVGGGWSSISLMLACHERGKVLHSYDFWDGCIELSSNSCNSVGLTADDPRRASWDLNIMKSVDGAAKHADGSVGLLFIDSGHSYKTTKEELEVWLPKMHPKGIICGHDYLLEEYKGNKDFGVKQAVDEFMVQNQARFRFQISPYSWGLFILWPRGGQG